MIRTKDLLDTTYQLRYTTFVADSMKLKVKFFKSQLGNEPVREWLSDPRCVDPKDKKSIGEDIKTVQFGWPLGMPIVRKLEPNLWEVRSDISDGRIARVIFTVDNDLMVLLHGFTKKEQKTKLEDLKVARSRLTQIRGEK